MKKQLRFLVPGLLAATALAGCEKFTSGYDINPNVPLGASTSLLLTSIEVGTGLQEEANAARLSGIWTQQFTGVARQHAGLDVYQTLASDYDGDWGDFYLNVSNNARLAEASADVDKNPLVKGIVQTIEGLSIGQATALWGDVPYSEAFNATITQPKFDAQKDVYTSVQALLTDAAANLAKPGASPGAADIFFAGSSSKWLAVANTLRARYALHTKDYANAAKYAALGVSAPANNLIMPHAGTAYQVDLNVIYSFLDQDRPGDITADGAFATKLLASGHTNSKTTETGRLNYFYTKTFVNGTATGYASVDYEPNIYDGAFTSSSPYPIVTYAETQLILAEAQIRTGNFTAALGALNAVRAYHAGSSSPYAANGAVKYDAYTADDFAAGGIAAYGAANANESLLKEILTEKYLSLVGQIEPFNDQRRARPLAGGSVLAKSLIGVTPKKGTSLPQRFLYPQIEITTNPNTPAQTVTDLFTPTSVNQ
ncbi:SusD/RagB family nutrient-binding outer membrane lipoprotein [Hymenobacter nivis]|uniref:SusD/RagB family nutrient-binding outer membrane lipoprotein n=1 Tax=Hymenobacter nivis TaxID=1850093 RepID=A0A502GX76_9BACT|nr:SusD/RagB family nutrient-binding outer membrane lipoprotein [Hymenobacter nivis]TPG67017.1 SusD/RagB family nutrient-binding outer membrane lipoprotein [Hymenobacter nivis]